MGCNDRKTNKQTCHRCNFHMFHIRNFYLFLFIEQGLLFRQSSCLSNNDCLIEVLCLATKELISLPNWYLTVAVSVGRSNSLGGVTVLLYLWKLITIADKESLIGHQNICAAHRPKMNLARNVTDPNEELTNTHSHIASPHSSSLVKLVVFRLCVRVEQSVVHTSSRRVAL
jgi:hypothetical protein